MVSRQECGHAALILCDPQRSRPQDHPRAVNMMTARPVEPPDVVQDGAEFQESAVTRAESVQR